jgi:hypothetical protein
MVYLKLTSLPNIETTFLDGPITCLVIDSLFQLTSFSNIEKHMGGPIAVWFIVFLG